MRSVQSNRHCQCGASGRHNGPRSDGHRHRLASTSTIVSVLTAPSAVGSGGGGASAIAASAATFSCVTFCQIGKIHLVDGVAVA